MAIRTTSDLIEFGNYTEYSFYNSASQRIFNTLKKPETQIIYVPQDPPTTGQLWPRGNW